LGGTGQVVGNGTGDYRDTTLTPGTVNWSGFSLLSGSTWFAQLLAAPGGGQTESVLVPATPATTFRTGAGAGFVNGTTATMNNVPPDAAIASIEMVVWDNSSGLYPTWTQAKTAWQQGLILASEGGIFNLEAIGGLTTPAPYLFGLESFNVYTVPEPSTAILLGLGGALLWRTRRGLHRS
jgi:hypothetical protein